MGEFIKRLLICGFILFFSLMCSIGAFTNYSNAKFESKSTIPTYCESSLTIVKPFDMQETDEYFIYSGTIANTSSNDVIIEVLLFTYNFQGRNIRTDGYTNLVVPANGVLEFCKKKTIVFYGELYNQDYEYVKVTINGKDDYLMHSNYNAILSEYNKNVTAELGKFNKSQSRNLFFGIVLSVTAVVTLGCAIYFVIKRDEYIY